MIDAEESCPQKLKWPFGMQRLRGGRCPSIGGTPKRTSPANPPRPHCSRPPVRRNVLDH
jgi:hypothetical protein